MSSELLDHSLELLAPLGPLRSRRMFGGHGIYQGDLCFALIAFEQLFLKADALSRPLFEAANCRQFLYEREGKTMGLNYFCAPEEAMESSPTMQPWARLALEAALRARAAKAAKMRAPKPPAKRAR